MIKFSKFLIVTALSLFFACGTAGGLPILDEVHFSVIAEPTGKTGLADATGISFSDAEYELGTLDFAGVPEDTAVTFYNFTFDPFSAPSPLLWAFSYNAKDYSFDLENVSGDFQDSRMLALSGSGTFPILESEISFWVACLFYLSKVKNTRETVEKVGA